MSEYIAVVAAILSAVGAIYSVLSFKKQHEDVSKTYKNLIDSYAELLGEASTSSATDLAKVRNDLEDVITGVTESLSHISGKEIHSSIKLLEKDDEALNVVTFLRDRESAPNREILNAKYPVLQNTAYSSILKNLDKEHLYFLSNDIKKMEDGGYFYSGSRKDQWKELYKSVLVVPRNGKSKEELLGFLTFDSKDKSAFSEASAELASSVSKLVSAALLKAFSSGGLAERNTKKQNA